MADMLTSHSVAVLCPLPAVRRGNPYDYAVPAGMPLAAGQLVVVPLGRREMVGIVLGPGSAALAASALRSVLRALPLPPLGEAFVRFLGWVADYTLQPPGAVLRLMLSGMIMQRLLRDVAPSAPTPWPVVPPTALRLSDAQQAAADDLCALHGFGATLLDGVAGAGKTEVYAEAMAATINRGQQVLLLLPEIALTAQLLERLHARLGFMPLLWHSSVTPARREQVFRAAAMGTAPLVIGARSALFLPIRKLGLIVVDEEHDPSFKQEDGVPYHGRDMAVVRARHEDVPLVLVSATPSLETVVNVQEGRYRKLLLPLRALAASPPRLQLIDLRRQPPARGAFLSPLLLEALATTHQAGQQSLLFLNRRGYAPLLLCRSCGHRFLCADCTAWLVAHKKPPRLLCHHCGHAAPLPASCPACDASDNFVACGPGIERIAEEVATHLPTLRLLVLASDLVPGGKGWQQQVRQITAGQVDAVIGTQLVAKGFHFPSLTLVGVVDADLGLQGGDPRAAERCFQLLHQVAGRSGRENLPGRVLVQTHAPDHPVLRALADGARDGFYAALSAERAQYQMPPYARLAAVVLAAADPVLLERVSRELRAKAPAQAGIDLFGPAPAALAKLRGQHRVRFLLRAPRAIRLHPYLQAWLADSKIPAAVRMQIDIDPQQFI